MTPDPKSGASANSAIAALSIFKHKSRDFVNNISRSLIKINQDVGKHLNFEI